MLFRIPVYVAGDRPAGAAARHFRARPLFFEAPEVRDESLNRLLTKLARTVGEVLGRLGKEGTHEELARWSFGPVLTQQRLEVPIRLRRRTVKGRFLFVTFRHLGRRLAFTPAVPKLWFDVGRNEPLARRAEEVLTEHFRGLERDDEEGPGPERLALTGTAWVTTLELNVRPPVKPARRDALRFLSLGAADKADGAAELRRVGRCVDWLYPDELDRVLLRDAEVAELHGVLRQRDRRPVLLLGPRQVGKTALVHELVYRRVAARKSAYRDRGNVWLLSPQRLISGMSFVGQWEDRLLAILKEAKKRRHVLYFDDLLGLFLAGLSACSSLSVAAVLKPYLEQREFRVLAEITPEAFRVLQERDRSFADLFHVVPVRPPTDRDTLRILVGVQRRLEGRHPVLFELDALPAAIDIQRRYERSSAFPGKGARLLTRLAVKAESRDRDAMPDDAVDTGWGKRFPISRDTVLEEFHLQSGLSLAFLDPRSRLERQEVLAALSAQVVGQAPALEAAADVIAVAKARLNDPDRPLASFLFLGPTGVGKTETAKAVARYLFGTVDRLVRFDMNEFVNPGSAARLVGTFNQPEGLLTAAVRRQPFAVVLLDEIEKADPEVFDLLLGVLGEGRLTDALGRTADFSNTIILLTSNLGVREAEGRLGFAGDDATAVAAVYLRSAEQFFRPEFFNRLDRVIPFRRLAREQTAQVAERLINEVLGREGLRQRKCVLNVDQDARERIVETGYDPALGARAMKRAIERGLTQPTAARLAALPVDRFTVINVRGTGATPDADGDRLCVDVRALEEVPALPDSDPSAVPWEQRVRRTETVLAQIEAGFVPSRPTGPLTRSTLTPGQYRYFALREQADLVREQLRALRDLRGEDRFADTSLPSLPTAERSRSPQKRIGKLRRGSIGSILRQAAAALNLDEFLRESAAQAAAEPGDADLLELDRQLALLQAMADTPVDDDGQVLVWIRAHPAGEPAKTVRWLSSVFQAGWSDGFGVEVEDVSRSVDALLEVDELLLLRGTVARRLAELEAGTHLICPAHAGFVPVRVNALAVPPDSDWGGVLRGDPFEFGPVIRIYADPGSTIDLRTGTVVPTWPTAGAFRAMTLSALRVSEP